MVCHWRLVGTGITGATALKNNLNCSETILMEIHNNDLNRELVIMKDKAFSLLWLLLKQSPSYKAQSPAFSKFDTGAVEIVVWLPGLHTLHNMVRQFTCQNTKQITLSDNSMDV